MSSLRIELLGDQNQLDNFDSGNEQLDKWLVHSSRVAAAAGTAATYVALNDDNAVIGYYALAMGSVAHAAAPSRLRRGMPDPVPVIVLARLAVTQDQQGQGTGGRLLVDAMRRAVGGARHFGARAVIVDAIDDDAGAFYFHFGFKPLEGRRLWQRITSIEAALGAAEEH